MKLTGILKRLKKEKKLFKKRADGMKPSRKHFRSVKKSSHDYRYFPDPDIPKMMVPEIFDLKKLKKELPELPWQRRRRYMKDFGIRETDAESFVGDIHLGEFFEKVINDFKGDKDLVKVASNFISSDLVGIMSKNASLKYPSDKKFAKIVTMFKDGKLSSRGAKDLLARLMVENIDPEKIAEKEGLIQKSDEGELKKIIKKLVAENPKVVADYRGGKEASLQFFVGQVMKITKGSANPQIIKKVLLEVLG